MNCWNPFSGVQTFSNVTKYLYLQTMKKRKKKKKNAKKKKITQQKKKKKKCTQLVGWEQGVKLALLVRISSICIFFLMMLMLVLVLRFHCFRRNEPGSFRKQTPLYIPKHSKIRKILNIGTYRSQPKVKAQIRLLLQGAAWSGSTLFSSLSASFSRISPTLHFRLFRTITVMVLVVPRSRIFTV